MLSKKSLVMVAGLILSTGSLSFAEQRVVDSIRSSIPAISSTSDLHSTISILEANQNLLSAETVYEVQRLASAKIFKNFDVSIARSAMMI
ncbi:MAG: hypothetical protein HQK54_02100 [Oligoflexales bacterium]|nr:hypothetical protein [Oligoflexales bacterium]